MLLGTRYGVRVAVAQTVHQPFACRGQEARGPNLEGGVGKGGRGPRPCRSFLGIEDSNVTRLVSGASPAPGTKVESKLVLRLMPVLSCLGAGAGGEGETVVVAGLT